MKNKLSKKEEADLVRLLGKVRLPASYPVFKALCKSVPMIAIDIAVMPDKDHVLLTYRDDEFFRGWHIPGSILLYKETIDHAIQRVIKSELKIKVTKPKFLNYFSYGANREHGVALLFIAEPKGYLSVKDGKVFPLSKVPKELLKVHVPEFLALRD